MPKGRGDKRVGGGVRLRFLRTGTLIGYLFERRPVNRLFTTRHRWPIRVPVAHRPLQQIAALLSMRSTGPPRQVTLLSRSTSGVNQSVRPAKETFRGIGFSSMNRALRYWFM